MDQPNQREFSRAATKMEVEITSDAHPPVRGITHDVSMSGVFVVCDDRMPVGTECRVAVRLAGGEEPVSVDAAGRVARVEPDGMGLQFTEIDMDSYEHLRRLVLFNSTETSAVERELRDHLGLRER